MKQSKEESDVGVKWTDEEDSIQEEELEQDEDEEPIISHSTSASLAPNPTVKARRCLLWEYFKMNESK